MKVAMLRYPRTMLCTILPLLGLTGCSGSAHDFASEVRQQWLAVAEAESPPGRTIEPKKASEVGPANLHAAQRISLDCSAWAMEVSGPYMSQNNVWGKRSIKDWRQCIGIGPVVDGHVSARWTWSWPHPPGAGEIKSYPAIIYGQKPGYPATPGSGLPRRISEIRRASSSWRTSSTFTGRGQLTYDIWLTSDPRPARFNDTHKTHEIMIVAENYGGYGDPDRNPAWYVETATIGAVEYKVYRAVSGLNTKAKWDFVVFDATSQLTEGSVDLVAIFDYLRARRWISGREYLSSVEFGTEVAEGGSGEVVLQSYRVDVK